ncbi:MAG: protein-S-isoprenylcysteine O-methyltransferase [Beijerinckiaceae bacterium]
MTPTIAKIIWVAMAVGWYFLRVPHVRRSKKTPIAQNAMDKAEKIRLLVSLTGLGIIPFVYIATGFPAFARRDFAASQASLGLIIAIFALLMFFLTHEALGRNWSVSLQMRENHKLITHGIYARIRHPMYTAFWLWAIAQALLLPNYVAGLSGLIGFGALYILRVGHEENLMIQRFGDEYRDYMKRTGRLLPKI